MRTPDTWTEQYLEDWVCANYDQIWGGPCVHVDLVGRQITLPSGGRLDVLLGVVDPDGGPRLVVMEIKRGTLDTSALAQLLSYVKEVRKVYSNVRISGLLLGADATSEVREIVEAMRGVEILIYSTWVDINGINDFSATTWGDPSLDRPGWFDPKGSGGEEFEGLRSVVRKSLNDLRLRRRRLLPVRVEDTPSRIYRKL